MSNKVPRHLLGRPVSWNPHSTLPHIRLYPFGNTWKCLLPSLTAKSCPVDNPTFIEAPKDAEEKYPPYSCMITATNLQNKELVEQRACACTMLVYLTMWNGFHPLFLVQTWSPNKHMVMMPTSLINTGNKPLCEAFSKDWFWCYHRQGSIIHTEALQRKRGGKPQFLLLLLALQHFWGVGFDCRLLNAKGHKVRDQTRSTECFLKHHSESQVTKAHQLWMWSIPA